MPQTRAQQRNAVSEGVALGLLLCGRDGVADRKPSVDLAFEGAWRAWPQKHMFPQVTTDLRNGSSGLNVLTHADRSRAVLAFCWERDAEGYGIRALQPDWSTDDESDVEFAVDAIGGEVDAQGWADLAQDFLRRLER